MADKGNSKFTNIRDEIELDFPIPKQLAELMKEAEELDLAGSLEYICVADTIDVFCKNSVALGRMTKDQWQLICWKYPINGK